MLDLTRLLSGRHGAADRLRYGVAVGTVGPVVVWNLTPDCNLRCRHCYAAARAADTDILSCDEALRTVDALAELGTPALLLSGGEPMLFPWLFDVAERARARGIRVTLSSNGTLIDTEAAARLKALDIAYVGISIDGTPKVHDRFRGVDGAYARSLEAMRRCRDAGIKVGLRVTMNRQNVGDLDRIFDFMCREGFRRVCFYHLVATGRAASIREDALSPAETRKAATRLFELTDSLTAGGDGPEVLTVDNHCDAPWLWLWLKERNDPRADAVLPLLRRNGGNASGSRFLCISWDGTLYPDQFWATRPIGSVRDPGWTERWRNPPAGTLLAALRDRTAHLTGRCAGCRFLGLCAGNLRARAEAAGLGPWGSDPGCYLTDDEIGGTLP